MRGILSDSGLVGSQQGRRETVLYRISTDTDIPRPTQLVVTKSKSIQYACAGLLNFLLNKCYTEIKGRQNKKLLKVVNDILWIKIRNCQVKNIEFKVLTFTCGDLFEEDTSCIC